MEDEWNVVSDHMPEIHCKLLVRNINDEVFTAIYNSDGVSWRFLYGCMPIYWTNWDTGKEIENVTHWKMIDKCKADLHDKTHPS